MWQSLVHRNPISFNTPISPFPLIASLSSLALLVVAWMSPASLPVVLQHGAIAGGLTLSAIGFGLGLVNLIGLKAPSQPWRMMLAAGLGLGFLAVLVLVLGLMGMLARPLWIGILSVGVLVGITQWLRQRRVELLSAEEESILTLLTGWRWLGLVTAIFAGLAMVSATLPPGTLWPAEGNGYDVLEYHLAVPREYFEAGRIGYLPHNIYSNFPFNVEMLYLLTIIVHNDPIEAVFTAQMLNVLMALLTVMAVWLAGREFGRVAGLVAGIAAGTCPFLTYLCGVAYVENGMLFWTALALACVLHACRCPKETAITDWRWLLVAGVFTGFACGCKYPAIPMVFLPLLGTVGFSTLWRPPRRLAPVACLVLGWFLAFAPWLIKNTAMTGNPVFPLAHEVFPERPGIWNDDGAFRWQQGHLSAPEDRPFTRRLERLWSEILSSGITTPRDQNGGEVSNLFNLGGQGRGSELFGPIILVAILFGGWASIVRRVQHSQGNCLLPSILPCWLLIALGLMVWLGWTHLASRFAVTLIPPAAVMLGYAWQVINMSLKRRLWTVLLLIAFFLHAGVAAWRLYQPLMFFVSTADTAANVHLLPSGKWPFTPHLARLNELLLANNRILLVGDARRFYLERGADYCVVFNRNPFAEAAEKGPSAAMSWLQGKGYNYLYADWAEMRRLRNSRYGFWRSLNEGLVAQMSTLGLTIAEQFTLPESAHPYATLFAIPSAPKAANGGAPDRVRPS